LQAVKSVQAKRAERWLDEAQPVDYCDGHVLFFSKRKNLCDRGFANERMARNGVYDPFFALAQFDNLLRDFSIKCIEISGAVVPIVKVVIGRRRQRFDSGMARSPQVDFFAFAQDTPRTAG